MDTATFEALNMLSGALRTLPVTASRLKLKRIELERAQVARLRRHLRTYATVAYGQSQLRRAQVEPDRAVVGDLSLLPPLTKSDLSEHFTQLNTVGMQLVEAEQLLEAPSTPRPRRWRNIRVLTTSGTQGRRSVVLTTPAQMLRDHAHAMAMAYDAARIAGLLRRAPVRVLAVVGHGTAHVSNVAASRLGRLPFVQLTPISASTRPEELLDRARFLRPDVVVGYASCIAQLIEAGARGDLAWEQPLVFSGAEPLPPRAVALASAVLGWSLFDTLGCTELGTLAAGRAGDLRVLPTDVVIEVVDRAGNLVPDGRWGAGVLATKLSAGIQPLVRFFIDDEVLLKDDGHPMKKIEIRGRAKATWRWGNVEVEVLTLRQICDEHGVGEVLATRTGQGVRIAVAPAAGRTIDARTLELELVQAVRLAGLADPIVELSVHPTLRRADEDKAPQRWDDGNDGATDAAA